MWPFTQSGTQHDAVCRSLGLGDFHTQWKHGQAEAELKLLLCPSFHPSLCLIFRQAPDHTQLQVTAAGTPTRANRRPSPTTCVTRLREPTLEQLEQSFRNSIIQPFERDMWALDGMEASVFCRYHFSTLAVENVNTDAHSAFGRFVATTITLAYNILEDSYCKNTLGCAGRYAGIDLFFPSPTEPPPAPASDPAKP